MRLCILVSMHHNVCRGTPCKEACHTVSAIDHQQDRRQECNGVVAGALVCRPEAVC